MDQQELNAQLLKAGTNLELIKELLDKGANINNRDKDGMTALHNAAIEGHIEIVKYLLKRGANLEAANNVGMTALHLAVYNRNIEVVRELIKNGAKLNIRDNSGNTALDYAVIWKYKEIVDEFMSTPHIEFNIFLNHPKLVFEELHKRMREENEWLSVTLYFLQNQENYTELEFLDIVHELLKTKGIPENLVILFSAFLP